MEPVLTMIGCSGVGTGSDPTPFDAIGVGVASAFVLLGALTLERNIGRQAGIHVAGDVENAVHVRAVLGLPPAVADITPHDAVRVKEQVSEFGRCIGPDTAFRIAVVAHGRCGVHEFFDDLGELRSFVTRFDGDRLILGVVVLLVVLRRNRHPVLVVLIRRTAVRSRITRRQAVLGVERQISRVVDGHAVGNAVPLRTTLGLDPDLAVRRVDPDAESAPFENERRTRREAVVAIAG